MPRKSHINWLMLLALLLVPMALAPLFYHLWWKPLPGFLSVELSGQIANLVGTVWIAAGVLLSPDKLKKLESGHPKTRVRVASAAILQSIRHIKVGILYVLYGALASFLQPVGQLFGCW